MLRSSQEKSRYLLEQSLGAWLKTYVRETGLLELCRAIARYGMFDTNEKDAFTDCLNYVRMLCDVDSWYNVEETSTPVDWCID